jgi:hypothetical protein
MLTVKASKLHTTPRRAILGVADGAGLELIRREPFGSGHDDPLRTEVHGALEAHHAVSKPYFLHSPGAERVGELCRVVDSTSLRVVLVGRFGHYVPGVPAIVRSFEQR